MEQQGEDAAGRVRQRAPRTYADRTADSRQVSGVLGRECSQLAGPTARSFHTVLCRVQGTAPARASVVLPGPGVTHRRLGRLRLLLIPWSSGAARGARTQPACSDGISAGPHQTSTHQGAAMTADGWLQNNLKSVIAVPS